MNGPAAAVGHGAGGLACAGALAAREWRVLVLEQASSPGGMRLAKQILKATA